MFLRSHFPALTSLHFDLTSTYHADSILVGDFAGVFRELDVSIGSIRIPILEVVQGGGGEAKVTKRLRNRLNELGWTKWNFQIDKRVDGKSTYATSHEVDHVRFYEEGTLALEIEWNNKDPFFDRDLDNFHRLHSDGAISVGIIVTRGSSFQESILNLVERFASENDIQTYDDLDAIGLTPTKRQIADIEKARKHGAVEFGKAWAIRLVADKFASSTTHWNKLVDRLNRGVGSPCPIVAIGIPIDVVESTTPTLR